MSYIGTVYCEVVILNRFDIFRCSWNLHIVGLRKEAKKPIKRHTLHAEATHGGRAHKHSCCVYTLLQKSLSVMCGAGLKPTLTWASKGLT